VAALVIGAVAAREGVESWRGRCRDLVADEAEHACGRQQPEVRQTARADTQQERIDLAARELAEVSDHLQAAARALRQSI
jgi:hypothetical protein